MNKKQRKLLLSAGFKIDGNNITWDTESLASIYFDTDTKLFSIDVKGHTFTPDDYDSIMYLSLDLNRMLGLVFELNYLGGYENV